MQNVWQQIKRFCKSLLRKLAYPDEMYHELPSAFAKDLYISWIISMKIHERLSKIYITIFPESSAQTFWYWAHGISCTDHIMINHDKSSLSDSGSFRARSQILERRSSVTVAAAVVFVRNSRSFRAWCILHMFTVSFHEKGSLNTLQFLSGYRVR